MVLSKLCPLLHYAYIWRSAINLVSSYLIIFPCYLLTYLQFSGIKWAKQRPGQNPFDVKSDEAIQI